jgi:hypothetical protein
MMNPPLKENVMFRLDRTPLYVHVMPDRWDSYGTPTFRSQFLFQLLKWIGGINESVQPGWYDFNAKLSGVNLIVTLEPHVE